MRLFLLIAVFAAARPAAAADLTGTVLETIDAGTYTYLRLSTAQGEKWAAVAQTKIAKGAKARVYGSVEMRKFTSKTLNRTFDHIVFGTRDAPAAAPAHGGKAGQGAAAPSPSTDPGPIKVDKADGADARTVAQIYAQKAALKGKAVVLRAKAVKVTPEIMGLNWVHLRDGSGDAKLGDNDLTVTTQDTIKLGQVVTVRGQVTLDKNLGGRYQFPVLLEGAKLVK